MGSEPEAAEIATADTVLAWVLDSIALRGGTGRRLGRIDLAFGMPDDASVAVAITELVSTGRATLDEPIPGFIYLIPTKA
jgi:hypothetical protein